MANISISNLSPAGSDLFLDCESYLTDIADRDLDRVNGGLNTTCATLILTILAFTTIV
ncbi:hypothetical protein [Pseudanabaena sp. PCC 6802]|uniref:hypothetical protein n=1 Tax=Pseudanabaena sp. PCC 6802 TaxID=118173 RepID=UPI00034D1975|nr:hypothetical protein [Pseudanabaena sp. PCC 6802]